MWVFFIVTNAKITANLWKEILNQKEKIQFLDLCMGHSCLYLFPEKKWVMVTKNSNKQDYVFFFLTQPRYTADHPALLFPIGLSQTMSYSCGWWPRKRHSACDLLLPALHAALMGNEPALAFLKRKTKAAFNQRTIICYWTSGRHIQQCYSTAVAVVIGRKSDVLLGLLKSEHKRKGVWWKHLYNVYVML